MSKNEKTSPTIASKASGVLSNPGSSKAAKTVAASALSQAGTSKQTSAKVASKAAQALDDGRSSKTTKAIAGSVLTQKTRK
jgi:hypothetical protein